MDTPDRPYRVKEFAAKFDFCLPTVYRWLRKGEIRSTRVGGTIFIPAHEVVRIDKTLRDAA